MGFAIVESGSHQDFPAKLTFQVIVCSVIAACGGLMFGYDIGISGGVTSMDMFLEKFFPAVYFKKHRAKEDNYCKFDDAYLQLFTSSLYLAAIVACFIASFLCNKIGRKPTIQLASLFFLAGAILNAASQNLYMLIGGRLLLGAGVGFGNQAVPLFISEMAPAKFRGGLNISFQLLITVGILIANLVNWQTAGIKHYGWRISLGGAAVPALILCLGSYFIEETPTSLIQRGKKADGKRVLQKIRGVDDVEREYAEICSAIEFSKKVKKPFSSLFKRSSLPKLFCGTVLQIFQQFTGINVVMFYAPVIFQTMGAGADAALLSAVITDAVNVGATFIAIILVDIIGRKTLLLEGCLQMLGSQMALGIILLKHLGTTNMIDKASSKLVVILIIVFVAAFAWSWGPLGWLIPSEMYPLETRTSGYFFAVSMNMFCTFLIAQTFLTMLCKMRAYIFFFFSAWIVLMGLFTILLLPETKGIPIDEMDERVWKKHRVWKRFCSEDEEESKKPDDKN